MIPAVCTGSRLSLPERYNSPALSPTFSDLVKAAPTTITVYTAAVRSLHVEHGDNDPFSGTALPPGYSLASNAVSART